MTDINDLLIDAEKVMRQCQRGTRNYQEANDLHAQCYGTIGALMLELKAMIVLHGPRTVVAAMVISQEAFIEIDSTHMSQDFLMKLMYHVGHEFKISNDHFAFYARLWITTHPQYRYIFKIKRMKDEPWHGDMPL